MPIFQHPHLSIRATSALLAAALLLFPGGGAYWYMSSGKNSEDSTTSKNKSAPTLDDLTARLSTSAVVTATKEIAANAVVEVQHLSLTRFPDKKVPRDALRDPNVLVGKTVLRRLRAGQIITSKDFAEEALVVYDPLIPTGYSAFVVQVDQSMERLGAWAVPGTRVDLRVKVEKGPRDQGTIEQISENAVIIGVNEDGGASSGNSNTYGVKRGTSVRLAIRTQDLERAKQLSSKGRVRIFQRGSQMIL